MSEQRDQESVAAGNRAFATALYRPAAQAADNVFFAPASISTALAMTYAGASGDTAAQMARALHFPALEQARLHQAFGALAGVIGQAPGVEIAIANALFGQQAYGFLSDFLSLLQQNYGAPLREVDFAAEEPARRAINGWVEERTSGKITGLVARGILTALTRLVVVNAVFFKGHWASQFSKARTANAPFYLQGGGDVEAQLMTQSGPFKLVELGGAQALELPYEGGALSMVVILPREVSGLAAVEEKLCGRLGDLLDALDRARPQPEVDVHLPRFKIEAELRLDSALKSLGMRLAFDQRKADFSRMNGRADDLFIAAVLHKAFVEVDEMGTTAAAATAAVVASRGGPPPSRPQFRADHPFVFLIRDSRTRSMLFLGRLLAPRS